MKNLKQLEYFIRGEVIVFRCKIMSLLRENKFEDCGNSRKCLQRDFRKKYENKNNEEIGFKLCVF